MITDSVGAGDYYHDFFWSGARDRWNDATEEQKEAVLERLEEFGPDFESDTEINDLVWFECDDIFFPEESEEDDVEESLVRRVRRLEKKISSDNKKSCRFEKKLKKTR